MKLSEILQTYKKRFLAITSGSESLQDSDPSVQSHLDFMVKRFHGALAFMSKNKVSQEGRTVAIKELPWFLFLGPAKAGKTALLAHSKAPYILQKHFTPAAPEYFEPTEHLDWWATRSTGIVDVPSQYLFESDDEDKQGLQQQYWESFMSLLKKRGGKKNINGIIIALPLPEIMRHKDIDSFRDELRTLASRVNDIEAALEKNLPCNIIITKCDLLTGFHEFFAEISDDELMQHWGITLPRPKKSESIEQIFSTHFNELIRKLNLQLLSRLHQERNPMARPYIKNFPLHVERLKAFISDSIKILTSGPKPLTIQSIYLTSALQPMEEPEIAAVNMESSNNVQNAMQIFREPSLKSRSYFIKRFIMHGLAPADGQQPSIGISHYQRKKYALYVASGSAIILAAVILGRDFRIGMEQAYKIQANLTDYHHVLQQFHNPNESMVKTLVLLETLHKSKKDDEHKNYIHKILNYYSDKSQKNAATVYNNALQAFLVPEIRNYFADYLRNPINQDAESIYSVFKAYLMLGDMTHFDSNYVRMILTEILPKTFGQTKELLYHFDAALLNYRPVQLDAATITNTRKYLLSLRGTQLGYIILKSMSNNTAGSDALLGDNVKTNALFTLKKSGPGIPAMFTGKNFSNVFEQEIQIAADEAATGNWILGTDFRINPNRNYVTDLAEEMRADYVKQYADAWETALNNIKIETPRDLEQADAIITSMTSYDSPLLRILNNIHENTFFEPVTTASPKLFSIGQIIDRNNTAKNELFQILTNLEALHTYLQPVLTAEDPRKAAYQLITNRMQHQGQLDPLTKLRIAADQAPMPLKGWINQLTNDTWHYLLKDAMHYLDTSWNEKVSKRFDAQMARRYPFSDTAVSEVSYQKFIHFFGKPGIIIGYFNTYLAPFVDTSKPEWTWKKLNGQPLPLSQDVLKQIQQAMNIHHAFFPNDDDNLSVPFALQKKQVAKNIESITLNINSKVIVDKRNSSTPHIITWPYNPEVKYSSVALNMSGNKSTQLDFPGSWGWFKLVSQSFESASSNNQIILNFSKEEPAKYILSTQGKYNPFIGVNLNSFNLPAQLTTTQA